MSTVALLVDKKDWDALNARLARLEEAQQIAAPEFAIQRPKEIARRYRIDSARVYADLRTGKLVASRDGKGWAIDPADAARWHKQFVRPGTNQ